MNDQDSTSPRKALSARPVLAATSGPSAAASSAAGDVPPSQPETYPDQSASVTTARRARPSKVRSSRAHKKRASIAAAALLCAVLGLAGCSSTATATSPSATAGQSAPPSGFPGRSGAAGGGSNARSGPAAGGSTGTVTGVSTSGFTLSTSAGQKVTVNESSSTTFQKGTGSASASDVTTGVPVLVLGTVNGTTITATQVVVQPAGGATSSTAAEVVPFERGTPSKAKQIGQVPANYTEGSGTIVSGATANKATEAALAAYPGGVVDRVVRLSSGEYEVHYIGVNWPHHIFVNKDFKVVGAN